MELFDVNLDSEHIGVGNKKWVFRAIPIIDNENEAKVVKPYLRLMSSMTSDEFEEFTNIVEHICIGKLQINIANSEAFDWLNEHHFDYRGLIEKGLALEALEGIYNLNKK